MSVFKALCSGSVKPSCVFIYVCENEFRACYRITGQAILIGLKMRRLIIFHTILFDNKNFVIPHNAPDNPVLNSTAQSRHTVLAHWSKSYDYLNSQILLGAQKKHCLPSGTCMNFICFVSKDAMKSTKLIF